jgi:DNA-binding CsgD family transcriptional regulator
MFPQKSPIVVAEIDSKTYPLGENSACLTEGAALSLVTLSHTALESRLYAAMLLATDSSRAASEIFTARRLMEMTGISSLSTIRRGLEGLVAKLSVERGSRSNGNGARDHSIAYRVFTPEQVIARRNERGVDTYSNGINNTTRGRSFQRVVERVLENKNLSRREAQVALCCVEGLTNAQIGERLTVTEQTVKFHLRNIFIKFGVRRRAELISRLLM